MIVIVQVRFFSRPFPSPSGREVVPRINYIGNDISSGKLTRQPAQKGFIKSGIRWKKVIIDSRVSRDLYDLRGSLRKRQITWCKSWRLWW